MLPESFRKDNLTLLILGLFVFFGLWWLMLQIIPQSSVTAKYIFGAVYGPLLTLTGGVIGIVSSRQWGGMKSVMGRAIIALSFGLLSQFFGQITNSLYNVFLHVEAIYPGIPDIGFFSSLIFYFYGIFSIARASGIKNGLRFSWSQIFVVVIPIVLLGISYLLFLQEYRFEGTPLLQIFLDFGYPLGQALNMSVAILMYILTRKYLGGIMKKRMLLFFFAFLAQGVADFSFLYLNSKDQYVVGGIVDFFYLVAYIVMILALVQLRATVKKLRNK